MDRAQRPGPLDHRTQNHRAQMGLLEGGVCVCVCWILMGTFSARGYGLGLSEINHPPLLNSILSKAGP
jgi:hypothetical protein